MDEARARGDAELSRWGRVLVRSTAAMPHRGIAVPLSVAVGACASVGLDWATGPDLSALIAYGAAVVVSAWLLGARAAVAVAAVSAVGTALVAGWHPDARLADHAVALNATFRFIVLAAVALGVALLARTMAILDAGGRTDPLTGLLNRRALFERAEIERVRAIRHGRSIAVAYIDLDGLKRVNDRDGHEAGDRMIAGFAHLLRTGLRTSDLAARIGGDEFVVVMPETTPEEAHAAFERMLDPPSTPSASVGIVVWTAEIPTLDVMVSAADDLMYRTKTAKAAITVCDGSLGWS